MFYIRFVGLIHQGRRGDRLCLARYQCPGAILSGRHCSLACRQRLSTAKAYDLNAELNLLDTLVRGDRRRDDNDKMRAGWKHGDVTPISVEEERIRNQNLGASIRLLDYRNLRWMKRIEAEIKSGQPTFDCRWHGPFLRL